MKKVLPFAGLIAFVTAAVALVLMLATKAIVVTNGNVQVVYEGTPAIFGKTEKVLGVEVVTKGSVLALIGFILLIVGLLASCCGVLGGLLKIKALQKLGGLLMLVAAGCFLVAGIFMFLVVPTFYSANDADVPSKAAIGAGWIIGAILALVGAAFSALPAVMGLVGKK